MADEVENTYTFLIFPNNLSAVQIYVWYGGTRLSYNKSNCTVVTNYLRLDTQQGLVTGTKPTSVEVSSSGYTTQTINNPVFDSYGNCYISLIQKLYAWENSDATVYTRTLDITDSSTIAGNTGGTVIYNSTGTEISYVISHTNNSITKPDASAGGGSNE